MKKINIDRPQISSEEIKDKQNFETLFARYKELEQQPFYKRYWMYMVLFGVFSAAGTYYLLQEAESNIVIQQTSGSKKTEITTEIREERIIDNKKELSVNNDTKTPTKISATENKSTNSTVTTATPLTKADTSGIVTKSPIASQNNQELENKIQTLNEEINTLKAQIEQLKAEQPLKPQEAKGNYLFKIDVLPHEFPKLSKHKDLLFQVPADEKNFSPEFVKTEWTGAKIKESSKGNYLLTLTKGNKSYTFKALPVFKGNAYIAAVKEYNQYHETLDSLVKEEKKKETQRSEFMK